MDEERTNVLSSLYGMITTVYRTKNIRTAEGGEGYADVECKLFG